MSALQEAQCPDCQQLVPRAPLVFASFTRNTNDIPFPLSGKHAFGTGGGCAC